jgi:hypothetical protein
MSSSDTEEKSTKSLRKSVEEHNEAAQLERMKGFNCSAASNELESPV